MGIELNELIVIVLGLIAGGALVVFRSLGIAHNAAIEALFTGMADLADRQLAAYGAQLKPVFGAAAAIESLIDEETDFAVQNLPTEVIEAAQTIVDFTQRFTDGEPPVEVAPPDPATQSAPINK
jgi:hypothetical protein